MPVFFDVDDICLTRAPEATHVIVGGEDLVHFRAPVGAELLYVDGERDFRGITVVAFGESVEGIPAWLLVPHSGIRLDSKDALLRILNAADEKWGVPSPDLARFFAGACLIDGSTRWGDGFSNRLLARFPAAIATGARHVKTYEAMPEETAPEGYPLVILDE